MKMLIRYMTKVVKCLYYVAFIKSQNLFSAHHATRVLSVYIHCVRTCDAVVEFVEQKKFQMQAMAVEMDNGMLCFMTILHDFNKSEQ